MLEIIEEWIHQINASHEASKESCSIFQNQFSGYYSPNFLKSAHFVVVEKIPKPDFPELREAGLGQFIDTNFDGITYDDTYYIQRPAAQDLRLHFHELVHVLQWRYLTPSGFIKRYITEIQKHGYHKAPLEKMAYSLEMHYQGQGKRFDIEEHVCENL